MDFIAQLLEIFGLFDENGPDAIIKKALDEECTRLNKEAAADGTQKRFYAVENSAGGYMFTCKDSDGNAVRLDPDELSASIGRVNAAIEQQVLAAPEQQRFFLQGLSIHMGEAPTASAGLGSAAAKAAADAGATAGAAAATTTPAPSAPPADTRGIALPGAAISGPPLEPVDDPSHIAGPAAGG